MTPQPLLGFREQGEKHCDRELLCGKGWAQQEPGEEAALGKKPQTAVGTQNQTDRWDLNGGRGRSQCSWRKYLTVKMGKHE